MSTRRRFVPRSFVPPSDYPGQCDFPWPEPGTEAPGASAALTRRSGLSSLQWDRLICWIEANHHGQTPEKLRDELHEARTHELRHVPQDVFTEAMRHAAPRSTPESVA